MKISEAQKKILDFEFSRGWNVFKESQIFTHLVEEISEIGRHILTREGYKVRELGHQIAEEDVSREFAQAFALFLQLANRMNIDLEKAFINEIELMEKRFNAEEWRKYIKERFSKEKKE
ncbi:MAG: hypothetical protein QXK95_00415 [Nitrososphaerota archaeon]|nr:hypothetical protein [Candidatus Geocrenenecus dongiae]